MGKVKYLLTVMILSFVFLFSIDSGLFHEDKLNASSTNGSQIVNTSEYDIALPVGSWWKYSYTYPTGQDSFTVSISQIESGENSGRLRRGDYIEYHPSDTEARWMIYELSEDTFTMFEDSGQVINPPITISENDLLQEMDCYSNCSVYRFQQYVSYPEGYMRIDDEITVPAGTFQDVLLSFSIDREKKYPPNTANHLYNLDVREVPYAVTHIRWYARGVGLVQCVDINSGDGSVVHRYELQSYSIPTPLPDGWKTICGSVSYDGNPVCAMVLANGQYMFTCKDGDDFGKYELDVPLDANEEITIQAFVSGLAPFRQTTDEADLDIDIAMQTADPESKSPDVTTVNQFDASTPANWARITGTVTLDGTPLCAMVLANGKYMFSCNANNGVYDLTVPLDGNGQITLFVFVSGLQPYKHTFTP